MIKRNYWNRSVSGISNTFQSPDGLNMMQKKSYQNLLRAVKALKEKAPETFRKISWLSITNQRETIVFDKKSGKPLSHAIV